MGKTAEYTKRAVDNYRNKFDMYQLRIPKDSGLREKMKRVYGKELNNKILELIEADLERLETVAAEPGAVPAEGNSCPF